MYILRDKIHKVYLTPVIANYTKNPLEAAVFPDYDRALAKLNEIREAIKWGRVEYKYSELEICELTFNIKPVK